MPEVMLVHIAALSRIGQFDTAQVTRSSATDTEPGEISVCNGSEHTVDNLCCFARLAQPRRPFKYEIPLFMESQLEIL